MSNGKENDVAVVNEQKLQNIIAQSFKNTHFLFFFVIGDDLIRERNKIY